MSAATASGADGTPGGAARSRDHNQGNQNRTYTVEQKAAVLRVRKCAHTAFYEILDVEKTSSDGEIKKAYRKLSLLTHPDKNGYNGADEAFKMVSRAFQTLSDPDKKAKFDRFGGDPDSRFGPGASSPSSPFENFARSPAGGRGPMFEEEISPEELFNRFFGGGGLGGNFGPFGGGGSQFVFNLGGGPGFRVHQFGGNRPRRRPREANGETADQPQSPLSILKNLLPLLILFVLPLLSSLFSGAGDSTSAGPEVRFSQATPYTLGRVTPNYRVPYWVNPDDIADYTNRKMHSLDRRVEANYIQTLQYECQAENQARQRMYHEAQGWFFHNAEQLRDARNMEMRSCNTLRRLGAPLSY